MGTKKINQKIKKLCQLNYLIIYIAIKYNSNNYIYLYVIKIGNKKKQ